MRKGELLNINGEKLQDIFIPISEVVEKSKRAREGDDTCHYSGMDNYLRKFHKFNNFKMTEAEKMEDEFRLRIRHIGWFERIFKLMRGS